MSEQVVIVDNESISQDNDFYCCDNVECKSLSEGLSKKFKVLLIGRKSKLKRSHKINLKSINFSSNIFAFLFNIFKTFKNKKTKYLLVAICPYTFLASLLLFLFKKNSFIYLRSNGYEEYKAILGFLGPPIYHIMYVFVTFRSKIITCQKRLVKKKNYNLVFPSELDDQWRKNITKPLLDKPRLLYVGRIKVEKGIFNLIKIFDRVTGDKELSIVGKIEGTKINKEKINLLGFESNISSLIQTYDKHNITILPSFTEAHPKILDESLARFRPVIIFKEIDHVIQNRNGIFVAERNEKSLSQVIEFVMKNYHNIQEEIKKNKLPTKDQFISEIGRILD